MKKIRNKARLWAGLLLTTPMMTRASVSLGAPASGPFADVSDFLQDTVDFLGGTGTMFVVFTSLVFGIGLWVSIPKQAGAALGYVLRACCGAIVLFGMAAFITYIKTFV